MSETKHTPGPWRCEEGDDGAFEVVVDDPTGRFTYAVIAKRGPWTRKTAESIANASLIAAAPDLLEALSDLWEWAEGEGPRLGEPPPDGLGAKVITALAKAEGR